MRSRISCNKVSLVNKDSIENVWHRRLGQPSFYVLKHIDCISVDSNSNISIYDVCPIEKQ